MAIELILKQLDEILIYDSGDWNGETSTKLRNTWPVEITGLEVNFILKSMNHFKEYESFIYLIKIIKHLLFRIWF